MNASLRQLRAFAMVARTGSFTEAARHLHLTQSALSGLLKELEGTLGVCLLHRSTRSVLLSDVGAEFLPLVMRILDDLDRAFGTITELKALRSGVVRVATPQLMACTLMPDVMGAFAQRHPKVQLMLADSFADSVIPKVQSGEVDLAIGAEREVAEGVDAELLFEMPVVAVVPQKHPLAGRRKVKWSELDKYPLVSVMGEYTRMLNLALAAAGYEAVLRPHMEVGYMTSALSMVSAGLGVTTCQPYAQSLIRHYGLRMLHLSEPKVSRRFYLFTRKDRQLSPAAHAFRDFLVDHTKRLRIVI